MLFNCITHITLTPSSDHKCVNVTIVWLPYIHEMLFWKISFLYYCKQLHSRRPPLPSLWVSVNSGKCAPLPFTIDKIFPLFTSFPLPSLLLPFHFPCKRVGERRSGWWGSIFVSCSRRSRCYRLGLNCRGDDVNRHSNTRPARSHLQWQGRDRDWSGPHVCLSHAWTHAPKIKFTLHLLKHLHCRNSTSCFTEWLLLSTVK